MNKFERAEKAAELKHSGFNCCQAVAGVFDDLVDIPSETLTKIASGFAAGMGCMEATCGSLIGAVMIAGMLKEGKGSVSDARNILKLFKQKSGATICRDLKGVETGVVLCECDDCVRNAVYALCEVFGIE